MNDTRTELVSPSRQAFHDFLDGLKEIDIEYLSEQQGISSEQDISEGQHYLTHLLKAALGVVLDNDPDCPTFFNLITPIQKMGGDGPDHIVFIAPLNGKRSYKIKGKRTGEVYISYTVHTGDKETMWGADVVSDLNDRQIEFDKDGNYEIILSTEQRAGNWMALNDDTICVISRHYYLNETPAQSDNTISPITSIVALEATTPPLPLRPAEFARKLKGVIGYMKGYTVNHPPRSPDTVPSWLSLVPNQLKQPILWSDDPRGSGFGAVDNAYSACPFVLGPEEALVIEGLMPECVYANVTMWNRYLQSFDYRYRQAGLNKAQIEMDADNRFRIILAHKNPGVKNWLDTEGRSFGTLYWRFLLPEGEIETPVCSVVRFAELHKSL